MASAGWALVGPPKQLDEEQNINSNTRWRYICFRWRIGKILIISNTTPGSRWKRSSYPKLFARSSRIKIFHEPRFPWSKGISRNLNWLLEAQVVWGRYNLTSRMTQSLIAELLQAQAPPTHMMRSSNDLFPQRLKDNGKDLMPKNHHPVDAETPIKIPLVFFAPGFF